MTDDDDKREFLADPIGWAAARVPSRYVLPEPRCRHKRKGIVFAGSPDGVHASRTVCDRDACIADALEWARASTRLPATYRPDVEDR
jgi:hypothetical protein